MMTTNEIRQCFLGFFKERGHTIVRSDSLVPQDDPTLLFTGAGMNQFKEYFLGMRKDLKRAASSQKCLRTGDLDEVGRTAYHHSFFEMLGNFSFGDYFKSEAIRWAWEFLTKELKVPADRLRVSVHKSDKESYEIWSKEIRVRGDWITALGDGSNFWPSDAPKQGPNGPCGPCSEIFYDQGEDQKNPHKCSIEHECGRFAEIWNLVFTQFDRRDGGELVPLGMKNIDTGMGLERLACVMQSKRTNFEIDIFQTINAAVREQLGVTPTNDVYAISDHVRAAVFAVTDGVIPSNEGRGYVIRKLIRRALWRAHQILSSTEENRLRRLEAPFLYKLVPVVADVMKEAYPDLVEAHVNVGETIRGEEERFLATLETGSSILEERIRVAEKAKERRLTDEVVFELYDTYGFPDELTRVIAHERGLEIDQRGFGRLMDEQRRRSKDTSQIAGSIFVSTDLERKLSGLKPTTFLGYLKLASDAKVTFVDLEGRKGIVVFDQTPFYAESGGQIGDQGIIENSMFRARVNDTQKKDHCVIHMIEVEKGAVKVGDEVKATVDKSRRARAMRNHTATHLLHAVLREMFGKQVRQLGSLVHPDRLRFDYSFSRPLSSDELTAVEDRVNEEILRDKTVEKEEKEFDEAKKEGAIAFFGEKYSERVRVVTIPDISKEFCGGTHCDRTGQIGAFVIIGDSSIASGVRRIEAVTGEGALRYIQNLRSQIKMAADKLRTTPGELAGRIEKLQEKVKNLEDEGRSQIVRRVDVGELLKHSKETGRYRLIAEKLEANSREELRRISDELRSKAKRAVWLLVCQNGNKAHLLVGLSTDLKNRELDAREILTGIAGFVGGSGGGRKDLAEGGGPDIEAVDRNWEKLVRSIREYVERKG